VCGLKKALDREVVVKRAVDIFLEVAFELGLDMSYLVFSLNCYFCSIMRYWRSGMLFLDDFIRASIIFIITIHIIKSSCIQNALLIKFAHPFYVYN